MVFLSASGSVLVAEVLIAYSRYYCGLIHIYSCVHVYVCFVAGFLPHNGTLVFIAIHTIPVLLFVLQQMRNFPHI